MSLDMIIKKTPLKKISELRMLTGDYRLLENFKKHHVQKCRLDGFFKPLELILWKAGC